MQQKSKLKNNTILMCAISIVAILLFLTAIGMSVFAISSPNTSTEVQTQSTNVADAIRFNIYSLVTPKIINFYESCISNKKVASHIVGEQRVKMMEQYGITSTSKLSGLLIVHDLVNMTGGKIDMEGLSKMKDKDVFALARKHMEIYKNSLSEQQRNDLNTKFNNLKNS